MNTIGPYQIQETLGKGRLGIVYKATGPGSRDVALRVLRSELSNNPELLKRLKSLTRDLDRLKDTHLLPVLDISTHEGSLYLVMPLVTGGSLAQRLAGPTLSFGETLSILRQVGGALASAHRRGLVHGALSPGNILFSSPGNCLLADFGLARICEEAGLLTSEVTGNPAYLAPEQVKGEPVDARTDIYSLGVVLYEMVAGHPPFNAANRTALTLQHVFDPPPPLHHAEAPQPGPDEVALPDVPAALERVIFIALAKFSGERFSTVTELVEAFAAAIPGAAIPGAAVPDDSVPGATIPGATIGAALGDAQGTAIGAAMGDAQATTIGAAMGDAQATTIGAAMGDAQATTIGDTQGAERYPGPASETQVGQPPDLAPEPVTTARPIRWPLVGGLALLVLVGIAVAFFIFSPGGPFQTAGVTPYAAASHAATYEPTFTPELTSTVVEFPFFYPATSTPAPTAQPVNIASQPLPDEINNYLSGVQVDRYDSFDTMDSANWGGDASYQMVNGQLKLTLDSWKNLFRIRQVQEGQGIVTRFRFISGAGFNFQLVSGDYQSANYHSYTWSEEPSGPNIFVFDGFQGSNSFAGLSLNGSLQLNSDTDYFILIAIGKNAEYRLVIWAPDGPAGTVEFHRRYQPWSNLTWTLLISGDAGTLFLDDWYEISFSEIR